MFPSYLYPGGCSMARKSQVVLQPATPKFQMESQGIVPKEEAPSQQPDMVSVPTSVIADISTILKNISPNNLDLMVQKVQDNGEPLFTKDDLRTTQHPLALILRLLFIMNHITKRKFEYLHRKLAQESCMPVNATSYARNNILRSLHQSDITWNFLDKLLIVLGYNLIDVQLTLQKIDTKEVFTISKSEALDAVKDNPYPPDVVVSKITAIEE